MNHSNSCPPCFPDFCHGLHGLHGPQQKATQASSSDSAAGGVEGMNLKDHRGFLAVGIFGCGLPIVTHSPVAKNPWLWLPIHQWVFNHDHP